MRPILIKRSARNAIQKDSVDPQIIKVTRMANVAVIGTQWGDEGKGKIVDWLSEKAHLVVRFQGGTTLDIH